MRMFFLIPKSSVPLKDIAAFNQYMDKISDAMDSSNPHHAPNPRVVMDATGYVQDRDENWYVPFVLRA
jgi:hypothetical protein